MQQAINGQGEHCTSSLERHDEQAEQINAGGGTTFSSVIEKLEADKRQLTADLEYSNNCVSQMRQMKEKAEEETARLAMKMEAVELDRGSLQQQLLRLTGTTEHLKFTVVKSVEDFISKLKVDMCIYHSKISTEG